MKSQSEQFNGSSNAQIYEPQNRTHARTDGLSRERVTVQRASKDSQEFGNKSRLDRGPAPHQALTQAVHQNGMGRDARSSRDSTSSSRLDVPQLAADEPQAVSRKLSRNEYKTRGSVRDMTWEGNDATIGSFVPTVKKVARIRELKAAPIDVFIPSMCSVGHLAKLLNVRLGGSLLPCDRYELVFISA